MCPTGPSASCGRPRFSEVSRFTERILRLAQSRHKTRVEPAARSARAGSTPKLLTLLVLLATAAAVVIAWFLLPVEELLKSFSHWIRGLGYWGYALFAGIYIVATVLAIPASPLTLIAGFVFGVPRGLLVVMVGATIGAALAFLVSRYLLRDTVKALIQRRPRFLAVDRAVAKDGWKVALMMQLSPLVPFNLQNYVFGVTRIPFWRYVATCPGLLPGVLLYLYLGAAGGVLTTGRMEWGAGQWSVFAVGFAATLAATFYLTQKARNELRKTGLEVAPRA